MTSIDLGSGLPETVLAPEPEEAVSALDQAGTIDESGEEERCRAFLSQLDPAWTSRSPT
jgi:hypothetical protein